MSASDPLAEIAASAIEHVNADHPDSLVLYCHYFADRPDVTSARMVSLDRTGFDVIGSTSAGEETIRIAFPQPVDDPDELRLAMVRMSRKARGETD